MHNLVLHICKFCHEYDDNFALEFCQSVTEKLTIRLFFFFSGLRCENN